MAKPSSSWRPDVARLLSISDDDLCSACSRCIYKPGAMSDCLLGWPFESTPRADYVSLCNEFRPIQHWGANTPPDDLVESSK